MDLELIETPCPACGQDPHERAHEAAAEPPAPPGPWRVVRCLGCESLYLRPRPAQPALLYDGTYHVYERRSKLGNFVRRLGAAREARRAMRYLPGRTGHVYEIGCGTGETLQALEKRGVRASGIEVSLDAARDARSRGIIVDEGAFEGGRGIAGEYDLVLAAHVIEHVENPGSFLSDIRRILRPGAVALVKTPLAGALDQLVVGGYSGSLDVPYHLCVLSERALRTLAADAGLEVVSFKADPVPNDYVHGLRRLIRAEMGLPLPFVKPWNPFVAVPLLPLSLLAWAIGAPGRARVVLRKPGP